MKTLITLLVFVFLPLVAVAEEPSPQPATAGPVPASPLPDAGVAMLEVSPMVLEIRAIFEQSEEEESVLLQQLTEATTDAQVEIVVDRLRQLDVDRTLAILRVQARYAHLESRFDLEQQLKAEMVAVLAEHVP